MSTKSLMKLLTECTYYQLTSILESNGKSSEKQGDNTLVKTASVTSKQATCKCAHKLHHRPHTPCAHDKD